MKKTNFLKIALTLVMAVAFIGVFGQEKDANLSALGTVDFYMTRGTTIPFYVTPDAYFNPGYVTPTWTVSSTFLWSFSVDPVSFSFSSTTAINPDITIGTVGSYVLNVVETSAGGCPDATPMSANVIVREQPTANFATLVGRDIVQCGTYTGAVPFTITDNLATNFLVDYTLVVQSYAADGTTTFGAPISTTSYTDVAFATAGLKDLVASTAYPVLENPVGSPKVTRYTFTITGGTNGINDAISRVSDYVNNRPLLTGPFTNYPSLTDGEYSIQVLPAPTTGPIYHLAN